MDNVHLDETGSINDIQTITILGATGSIGKNTVDVVLRHPDKLRVFALTANQNIAELISLACKTDARYVVIADDAKYSEAKSLIGQHNCHAELLCGEQALSEVARDSKVQIVMSAIVGAAGLLPTLSAVKAGKKVLLANKESLVMSGELFISAVNDSGAELIPIDSEHNAIFQCLPSTYEYGNRASSGIDSIILTGSGGPFIELPLEQFSSITPEQACNHPNWNMGKKISVDSASMMNKGLEFIEAKWLFGIEENRIQVVLHPQSTIHSMVQYIDGSVIAQMGNPDMRTSIAFGLSYPARIISGVEPLNFSALKDFSFMTPCKKRYPNLFLCIEACKQGQSATTSVNASNEIAVDAFLAGHITFDQIYQVNDSILQEIEHTDMQSIQQILNLDSQVRTLASSRVRDLSK